MSVYINDKKYQIRIHDTPQTMRELIASDMNTLPKFLIFTDEKENDVVFLLASGTRYMVKDILGSEIRADALEGDDFSLFYRALQKPPDLEPIRDILIPWIIYNPRLYPDNPTFSMLLEESVKELGLDVDVSRIILEKNNLQTELELKIRTNRNTVKARIDIEEILETKTEIDSTEFELEKTSFLLTTDMNRTTLYEIFDAIQLTSGIPFASIDSFYKILKGFIPFTDWIYESDGNIVIKVPERKYTRIGRKEDYSTCIVDRNDDEYITLSISLDLQPNNISTDEFIRRIRELTPEMKYEIIDTKPESVNGVFYIPNSSLNSSVFSDLVLTDDDVSTYFSIDESIRPSREARGLYVIFSHDSSIVRAILTEKVVIDTDKSMKTKDRAVFSLGSKYIRVKVVKATSENDVTKFQKILSNILLQYRDKYDSIVREYRKYIPSFGDDDKKVVSGVTKTKIDLKSIAPDIFLPEYSRKCANQPTIVPERETRGLDPNYWMLFPKTPEESTQRYYVCNHPKHPYPAIITNMLSNKNRFPLIPCCHASPKHRYTPGSKYRQYYYNEKPIEKVRKEGTVFRTKKIAPVGVYGVLPQPLDRMFNTFEPNHIYYRSGVTRTKSSFLECVIEGCTDFDDDKSFLSFSDEERENYVKQERRKLARFAQQNGVCKQEMYNNSSESITNMIADVNVYLNPLLFVRLLEERYNCNIFILGRRSDTGELLIPNHTGAYLRYNTVRHTVIVFEHMGSESDVAEYPQCELIVGVEPEGLRTVIRGFFPTEPITLKIHELFNQMVMHYELSAPISAIPYIPGNIKNAGYNLISQVIDTYGKVRALNIEITPRTAISIITDPIPPISLRLATNMKRSRVETALSVFAKLGCPVLGQIVTNGEPTEIYGKIDGIRVAIPLLPGQQLTDAVPIKHETTCHILEKNSSHLSYFNTLKRMGRYITEYTYWLFVKYLSEINHGTLPGVITDDNIANFANEKMIIEPTHEYDHVPSIFTLENNSLIRDDKLVVKSDDMRKRLVYLLRMVNIREKYKLHLYLDNTVMTNYYDNISDFEIYPGQTLLYGVKSITDWITRKTQHYHLQTEITPTVSFPFFYRNKRILDGKIFLSQNTTSVDKAIDIGYIWATRKYNPGTSASGSNNNYSATMYSYANRNNMREFIIEGDENDYKILFLSYKILDELRFTVLLSLDD